MKEYLSQISWGIQASKYIKKRLDTLQWDGRNEGRCARERDSPHTECHYCEMFLMRRRRPTGCCCCCIQGEAWQLKVSGIKRTGYFKDTYDYNLITGPAWVIEASRVLFPRRVVRFLGLVLLKWKASGISDGLSSWMLQEVEIVIHPEKETADSVTDGLA